jgi:putative PIN family toxin of toxin-antitoxin system
VLSPEYGSVLDVILPAIYHMLVLRVVVDTDVMVAAMRSDAGASRLILRSALLRRFDLLLSVPLVLEYEAVLKRAIHLKAAGASAEDIDAVLDAVSAVGMPITSVFSWRPLLADPADEMVLETAVNGYADIIITFNLRHLGAAARRFGIGAMRPPDAIWFLEV